MSPSRAHRNGRPLVDNVANQFDAAMRTLEQLRETNTVHVRELIYQPQIFQRDDGVWYAPGPYFTPFQLCFQVWIIPYQALERTETPGGPVWSGRVALEEYRSYRFGCALLSLESCNTLELTSYLRRNRLALEKVDFDLLPKQTFQLLKLDIDGKVRLT